ncbi:hypothetical protein P8629_07680 [Hydrogenovibrio sp. 3SP14C1]|uniref:hypothetical protein n=1 Tax=Hydrogenovibrio sp. 3SP14C1 TaxID=3038774 RepID=UPI002416354F|nr:hypothetical protein [Hydrogenovibrio sp. 3SP14C1]MDG4812885.1 hypothetical protein [Hydrogenovibrio sp. 3SP14C1]
MDEYKLLIHVLKFCEENGSRHSNVHFDVDHKLVEELYDRYGVQPSIDELKQIVDRCYARDWLEHAYYGSGRHNDLKLTSKGMGVATSKRKSEELRKNRPLPKKVSDYIEDHKGLFVLLGSCIALASLIISFLAKGSGNG